MPDDTPTPDPLALCGEAEAIVRYQGGELGYTYAEIVRIGLLSSLTTEVRRLVGAEAVVNTIRTLLDVHPDEPAHRTVEAVSRLVGERGRTQLAMAGHEAIKREVFLIAERAGCPHSPEPPNENLPGATVADVAEWLATALASLRAEHEALRGALEASRTNADAEATMRRSLEDDVSRLRDQRDDSRRLEWLEQHMPNVSPVVTPQSGPWLFIGINESFRQAIDAKLSDAARAGEANDPLTPTVRERIEAVRDSVIRLHTELLATRVDLDSLLGTQPKHVINCLHWLPDCPACQSTGMKRAGEANDHG